MSEFPPLKKDDRGLVRKFFCFSIWSLFQLSCCLRSRHKPCLRFRKVSLSSTKEKQEWESLGLQGDPPSPFWRRSALGFLWKEWCYSWNSSTLATSCEELTHWKRLWCWEGLGAGGEGDDRGWDGWMALLTRCTWVWVNFGSWWWTGRPGVLRFMGSQRGRHDWATELNWIELKAEEKIGREESLCVLIKIQCCEILQD